MIREKMLHHFGPLLQRSDEHICQIERVISMQFSPDKVNESENKETSCSYSIEFCSFGLALVSQFDNAFSLIVSVDRSIDVRCSAGAEIDSRGDAKTISCALDINCL